MEKIFYQPSKFAQRGEKFETPSNLGGTFIIEFVEASDDKFIFLRRKTRDWPETTYTFTVETLVLQVFVIILDKYDRQWVSDESRKKYEAMLKDPHIDRVERY